MVADHVKLRSWVSDVMCICGGGSICIGEAGT